MPNAIVRANAQTMPSRLFLAAGPAAAVFATLRGAKASARAPEDADAELFALVEEGKHWNGEIDRLCTLCDSVAARNGGCEVLAEDEARLDEAHEKYADALWAAMNRVPQTVAGFRALLGMIAEECKSCCIYDDVWAAFVANALASPVLAEEA
jgi:hypothetical protein